MTDIKDRIASLPEAQRKKLLEELRARGAERTAADTDYDVVILGGGFAGLTLALELRKHRPDIRILVVEKQKHPVPEATHKVGESSVEITGYYLRDVLGLEEHLRTDQLRKLGLRMFLHEPHTCNRDLAKRVEVGVRGNPPLPTYQLDRGLLENVLGSQVRESGAVFLDGCKIKRVELGAEVHHVSYSQAEELTTVSTRWVVDATGRRAMLKRQLELGEPLPHQASSSWFRIGYPIDVETWSDDAEWQSRVTNGYRWRSTNHLLGPGYWVWIIRLVGERTSVGIVADTEQHPFESFHTFEKSLQWLQEHEPQLAADVACAKDRLEDFRVMKNYSYGCRQVFGERWALSGESGVFTDPLYSPGNDFIAIANGLICDLVCRDLDGEDIRARTGISDRVFLTLVGIWVGIYRKQYALLGNAQVMSAKIIWDTALYWAVFCLLYFHDAFPRLGDSPRLLRTLHDFNRLSDRVQAFFREWDAIDQTNVTNRFVDYYWELDFMKEIYAAMDAKLGPEELAARFEQHLTFLERLAGEMVSIVLEHNAQHASSDAVLQQLRQWQTDPYIEHLRGVYRRDSRHRSVPCEWINLAHRTADERAAQ